MKAHHPPLPIFDTKDKILNSEYDLSHLNEQYNLDDINIALDFLKLYKGSVGTFNSYRREIERLIHWSILIKEKSLSELKRQDIEEFIEFCQRPPKKWIGVEKPPKFITRNGQRLPNPTWRPFNAVISKSKHTEGIRPTKDDFALSNNSVKEIFAILSSFYNYLLQEDYAEVNPIALVRQKSKFIRKSQELSQIRRLSKKQWKYVIQSAKSMASDRPEIHERTLFIISALYLMYLRISELTATERWIPVMSHFHKDNEGNWWFTTVGKGNKQRNIAVSDSMLSALERWRIHLGLSPRPSVSDISPLLIKEKGKGAIKSTNLIRNIVQECFNNAIYKLEKDSLNDEADELKNATVHWLRHTGISDDVKTRPREHVRDDAGHSSGAITDKYIDIEKHERYKSAKDKTI